MFETEAFRASLMTRLHGPQSQCPSGCGCAARTVPLWTAFPRHLLANLGLDLISFADVDPLQHFATASIKIFSKLFTHRTGEGKEIKPGGGAARLLCNKGVSSKGL